MDELVFINSNNLNEEPFTTSKIIAEYGGQEHRAIRQLIKTYTNKFHKLGRVTFEMIPLRTRGGFQNIKIYKLNEQQATFLITLMKNTERVVNFKFELTKQFYLMKQKLIKIRLNYKVKREVGKIERRSLTDSIKELPPSPHKEFKYKHYTDLFYKIIFGKNAQQLRAQFGITKKDHLRDYFTPDELHRVTMLEKQAGTLIDLGLSYQQIKKILINKYCITA